MKKVYRLKNLDCANCAAKMERAISRIDGVEECVVNFLTQRLTLVCDESRLAEITEKAVAACKKVEPDCTIEV